MEILQIWNSVWHAYRPNMITYTQDDPSEAPYWNGWNGWEEESEDEEEEIIDLCDE
jgi:hypothetical protein